MQARKPQGTGKRRLDRRGFTFIELMVAISILAVLMAIMIPRLVTARYQAYHSACMENEKMIATALESYSVDYGQYPTDLNILATSGKQYIGSLPVCPSNPSSQYQTTYSLSTDQKSFTISCPGVHYLQNPGIYNQYFPQYISTGQLTP